jgi:hypothetical protein
MGESNTDETKIFVWRFSVWRDTAGLQLEEDQPVVSRGFGLDAVIHLDELDC